MEEKKTQKHLMRINEALYRVTDLLPDQEPTKWMMRKQAMEALALFGEDTPALFPGLRVKKREEFTAAIHQLLNLLEFASHNTFISRVNFEVLSREYRSLLKEREITGEESEAKNDREEEAPLPMPKSRPALAESRPAGESMLRKPAMIHGEELGTEERRKRIFSYIIQKDKGVTMQELLEIFKGGVNQRTLQRDLTALIEKKRVKTIGARRWRIYSVV